MRKTGLMFVIGCLLSLYGFAESPVTIKDIRWSFGPPMRSLLKLQAQGVVGERIIVAAGTQVPSPGGDNSTNRAWLFDPRTSGYEELPNAPKAVAKTAGAVVGEALYVIGGMDFKPGVTRQVWRLSRRSGQWGWEEMPPMPFPRIFPGVAVVGTTIIVLGGQCVYDAANPAALSYPADLGVDTNSVIAFDTKRPQLGWFELPPIPGHARTTPAVAAVGSKIYVFGGRYYKTWANVNLLVPTGDAYVLDFEKLRWRQLPDLPAPVWGAHAVTYGKGPEIVLLGGIKNGRVEHPYGPPQTELLGPNLDVTAFDAEIEQYRVLPTPLPAYPMTEGARQQIAEMIPRAAPYDWVRNFDFSKGNRRVHPRGDFIGDRLYVIGSIVIGTEAHATNDFLIGTVIR